jgi:hypothetical protein
MKKTTCVFGDLTALYSARSKDRKPINYSKLNSIICKHLNIESLSDELIDDNTFYTLFSETNEKQVSFVKGLSDFGWNVETMNPKDIPRHLNWQNYRFDTKISYQIGLGVDNLFLITDSFDLYPIIKAVKEENSDNQVCLAFFGSSLDPKWWKVLREENNFIKFVDLDKELYSQRGLDNESDSEDNLPKAS